MVEPGRYRAGGHLVSTTGERRVVILRAPLVRRRQTPLAGESDGGQDDPRTRAFFSRAFASEWAGQMLGGQEGDGVVAEVKDPETERGAQQRASEMLAVQEVPAEVQVLEAPDVPEGPGMKCAQLVGAQVEVHQLIESAQRELSELHQSVARQRQQLQVDELRQRTVRLQAPQVHALHTELLELGTESLLLEAPRASPHPSQFVVDEVSTIIKEAVESTIGGNSYQHAKVNQWTSSIVETLLGTLTKQQKPFKYIGKFDSLLLNASSIYIDYLGNH
ncbi:hypothetical protein FOCC_FOCC003443 [Frankliniella occidentalis]|nr:hypothetical protein FOCC_FOCC003443 [Frankliniella occidentalis]